MKSRGSVMFLGIIAALTFAAAILYTTPSTARVVAMAKKQNDRSGERVNTQDESSKRISKVLDNRKPIKEQIQDIKSDEIILEVSFKQHLPAGEFLRRTSPHQVKVEYLTYNWGEHSGWYVLTADQSLEEALRDFEQSHYDFLVRGINQTHLQDIIADLAEDSGDQLQLENSRAKLIQEFSDQLSSFQNNGISLSGFAVKDSPDTLQEVIKQLPNDEFSIRAFTRDGNSFQAKTESGIAPQAAASGTPYPNEPWKFSPSNGVISYDATSKYFTSSFYWTDVSGFNSTHSAYEHDITIGSPKDAYVRPGPGAYYSNLPGAYVDTTFMDSVASFTIGSASATQIRANYGYYTQVPVQVTNPNYTGSSNGTIQPQVSSWAGAYDEGESPSELAEIAFCVANSSLPAYCVFADQTHTIKDYYTSSNSSSSQFFPFNHSTSRTYSWTNVVATPKINPGSLSSQGPVTASISTATSGATIRYTTNGIDPTSSSPIYSGPLYFTSSVTLKARAFKSGLSNSNVASATYSIVQKVATPNISPGSGSYSGPVTASISTATSGATIRYTTNGVDPTSSSPVYSGPLYFTSSVTLKARAFKSGMTDSNVATATYSIGVSTIAWEFNTNGNYQGWGVTNAASSVLNGILFIDPYGSDPYVSGPSISANAASYRYVQLRLASNALDGSGAIYFRTQAENFYSEDKKVTFSVSYCSLCGNAPFYSYTVWMGQNSKWAGTITGIRIDPANNGRSGTNTDSIGIDYIRLTP